MKKETITMEVILKEEKKRLFHSIIGFSLYQLLLTILILPFIFEISLLGKDSPHILPINIGILLIVLWASVGILVPIQIFKDRAKIKKRAFQIVTDELIGYKEKKVGPRTRRPHKLIFKSYGEYGIPSGKNYRFSERYAMSDDGVYNQSIIGDTFYLVVDDKEKIYAVYNTKWFEFIE